MKLKRLFCFTARICLFFLFLISGCGEPEPEVVKLAPEPEKPLVETIEAEVIAEPEILVPPAEPGVNLALQFTAGDVTTYEIETIDAQEVNWKGSVPRTSSFKNGRNYHKVQMTFTQKILSVDDNGIAKARITIDKLRDFSIVKNKTAINFDSSKKDEDSILSKLIGRSYTISITPAGKVSSINSKKARVGLTEFTYEAKVANDLLKPDAIKRRHALLRLPNTDLNPVQPQGQWSNTKTHSFGLMGSSAFERIYTLEDIEGNEDGKLAVASMEAIPSAEAGEERPGGMSGMFDTQETYAGQLIFDSDNSKVKEYSEKLDVQWTAVMPAKNQQKGSPPVLKMSASRSYDLKKVD
ncbi:MAG: hypothetical protein ACYSUK_05040 [Planctomycetota bacterium]|jgi:hypothetical protein